jgi:hypothetical protein
VDAAQAMTGTDHADDAVRRADRLYAARAAMAEAEQPARRLGIADIVQLLGNPMRSLSMDEQRALFSDPQLRADYRRLKAQFATVELPALAAASTGQVNMRRFEGGTVNIHPSRVPGQTYVLMRFGSPAGVPHSVLIESSQGELIKRALPPADPNGEIMLVLDDKIGPDQEFLRLISDPTSSGSFLA